MITKEKNRCPFCDELLKYNKKGVFTNKDENIAISSWSCEDCDQMYAIIDGQLQIAPFDAEGNLIKLFCKVCEKEEHFRQKMIFIVNDNLLYEEYCPDCAIEFLRNTKKFKVEVNKSNVEQCSDVYSSLIEEEVINDPEKLKKIMESETYKKFDEAIKKQRGKK